jgi:hypothetical protein
VTSARQDQTTRPVGDEGRQLSNPDDGTWLFEVYRHCGWSDPSYEPPATGTWSEEERVRRLSEPCTPTSDISTFITPSDLMHTETD